MDLYKNVLACVTQQKNCERIIESASNHKDNDGSLFVLHVAKEDWNFLDNIKEGEALDYLFVVSKTHGADMTVLRSENVILAIVDFVKKHNIDILFMGKANEHYQKDKFYKLLKKELRHTNSIIEVI